MEWARSRVLAAFGSCNRSPHQSGARENPGQDLCIQSHCLDHGPWTSRGQQPMLGLRLAMEILGHSPQRAPHHHTNCVVNLPASLAHSLPSAEPRSEAEATHAIGPGKMMPWNLFGRQEDSLFEQVPYHPRTQKATSL